MTDDERQAAHEKDLRFIQALGREIQRTEARDGEAARDEILAGLADGLPPEFAARVLGQHLDRTPGAAAGVAAGMSAESLGKVVAAQFAHDPEASVEFAGEMPAEAARQVTADLVRSGKVSEDDQLAALAAARGLSVEEYEKQLLAKLKQRHGG
jgi:hypothetical protein